MGYDAKAIQENIKKCDDNIKTFEAAIQGEMDNKKRLRAILISLEEKEQRQKEMEKRIEVVRE
ncbi:hypothetical protein [Oceanihabitans sediminis]|uniref:hypothetical protein n=1 Tax=Oceanihabitans sediminis TaxID=1812012 RepID=UPI00299E992A|nr:hypothetical protein [Oceanihabitans sediminis]MDX1279410.1 hypothetical protein [Oceanihabitans sediminis]